MPAGRETEFSTWLDAASLHPKLESSPVAPVSLVVLHAANVSLPTAIPRATRCQRMSGSDADTEASYANLVRRVHPLAARWNDSRHWRSLVVCSLLKPSKLARDVDCTRAMNVRVLAAQAPATDRRASRTLRQAAAKRRSVGQAITAWLIAVFDEPAPPPVASVPVMGGGDRTPVSLETLPIYYTQP